MFHVEHSPVQKPPAQSGGPEDQLHRLGVQRQHRKQGGHIAQGTWRGAIELQRLDAAGGAANAKPVMVFTNLHAGEQGGGVGAVADQPGQPAAAKGAAATADKVDRFQQTGFAAAVGADNQIQSRRRRKLRLLIVTEIRESQIS